MARGRWSQDGEGWRSRQGRGGGSGGNGGSWRSDSRQNSVDQQLREENKRLQQQVRDIRAQARRPDGKSGEVVAHPNAREGPPRHGDWQCVHCQFKTNRYSLEACFRCAVSKTFSFPSGACASAPPAVATPISLSSATIATPMATIAASSIPSPSTSASTSPSSPPSYAAVVGGSPATSGGQAIASVPASANGLSASNGVTGPGQPALVGPEGIKALKGQLERLVAAKAQLAADPLLAHVSAGLEAQIQGVRCQLSSAQPVEVALRGTLGAVSSARQSLSKAEQKAAKLEAQVVAAVASYEAAAQEVQACKKALADAEEATARTAGGRFDPRLLMGSHPGAALAVLAEAAAARCVLGAPGVDAAVISRVQAAFQEVQAACRTLPAEVPAPAAASTPEQQIGKTASGGITGGLHGTASSGGSTTVNGDSASVRAATEPHQHLQALQHQPQHQQQQQQQLQQQQLLQQQAFVEQQQQQQQQQAGALQQTAQHEAAAELARQHAQAALAHATQQAALHAAAAAVATPVSPSGPEDGNSIDARPGGMETQEQPPPCELVSPSVPTSGSAPGAPPLHHIGSERSVCQVDGAQHGDGKRRDDDMGGGASDGIANKRTAAEAIETARVVAAKAKARAS